MQDRLIINFERHYNINLHFILWCICLSIQGVSVIFFTTYILYLYCIYSVLCWRHRCRVQSLSKAWEDGSDVDNADGNSKGRVEGMLGVQRGSANRIILPMSFFSRATSLERWGGSSGMGSCRTPVPLSPTAVRAMPGAHWDKGKRVFLLFHT